MDLKALTMQIKNYEPYNEQEEKDKQTMLKYIRTFDNILTRENELVHFTATGWIVNKKKTKALMIYHNIYQSWTLAGGHADGEANLLEVAIREVKEETGVKNVKVLKNDIFSLEILTVNGHVKRGKYVSSHLHLNLTYILEVEETEKLQIKEDEDSGVKWIPIECIREVSNENWIKENIFTKKLNQKLKEMM